MAAKATGGKDGSGKGPDGIMSAAEMKPLLHLSKRQPVSCVVCLTKDKLGVILLHRRLKPRKLMADLRTQATGAGLELDRSTLRFGRATVDGGSDSSKVHISVNKTMPDAVRLKVLERLRPAGFQHCEIVVDERLETEADDETAGQTPHAAPTQAVYGAADATRPPPQPDTEDGAGGKPSPPGTPAASATAGQGAPAASEEWQTKLRTGLTGLVRQIATSTEQGSPRRAELVGLGDKANQAIKTGDRSGAVAGVRALQQALQAPATASPHPNGATADPLLTGASYKPNTAPAPASPSSQPAAAPPTAEQPGMLASAWDYTKRKAGEAGGAIGEFDASHGHVLVRAAGVAQAVGGLAEAGTGAVIATGGAVSTATGVGAAPGIPAMVGGGLLAVNGADNAVAGLRTVWTGQATHTLASQAAGATAHALGASDQTADRITDGVDLTQGIAGGVGAAAAGIARKAAAKEAEALAAKALAKKEAERLAEEDAAKAAAKKAAEEAAAKQAAELEAARRAAGEQAQRTAAEREASDEASKKAAAKTTLGQTKEIRNGYTYTLDESRRVTKVEGELVSNAGQGRNSAAQLKAGGKDRLPTDQGGHFVGRRFDGPLDDFNHFAQDSNFNQGPYKKLENLWQKALDKGSKIHVEIRPSYPDGSLRPSSIDVIYSINGKVAVREFMNATARR